MAGARTGRPRRARWVRAVRVVRAARAASAVGAASTVGAVSAVSAVSAVRSGRAGKSDEGGGGGGSAAGARGAVWEVRVRVRRAHARDGNRVPARPLRAGAGTRAALHSRCGAPGAGQLPQHDGAPGGQLEADPARALDRL
eukprot:3394758-Prymnesium_polylepis.1